MKYSGIGGQAVMEGVMMKNGSHYAVAVRKPDGSVVVDKKEYGGAFGEKGIRKLPFFRGIFNFADSLVLGMRTLMYSASFFEDEEAEKKKQDGAPLKEEKKEELLMGGTLVFSVLLAVVVFMLIPYFLSRLFAGYIKSGLLLSAIEGMLRLAVLLLYLVFVSKVEDIHRLFMYHGAEHKCINCIEHGMELTVENVKKSSRRHKRCGTSFLFLVIFISIIFFMFIQTDSAIWRIVLRIMLVPVIASVSYELLRLAGRSENIVVELLSIPGLALQRLTTREPDDSMIEVGIASVEAVFDWREFIKEVDAECVSKP